MLHAKQHIRCPQCDQRLTFDEDERPYCPSCMVYFDAEGNSTSEADDYEELGLETRALAPA